MKTKQPSLIGGVPAGALSKAEQNRLERLERSRQNRRGRKAPAVVPSKLARTSAFAPKRRNLITDSSFNRLYEVPGHSVIMVQGRELGSQHRDAIYAVFRRKAISQKVPNPNYRGIASEPRYLTVYETRTTWRELLSAMGRTEHTNNLLSLLSVFSDIQQVVITVYEGEPSRIRSDHKKGLLSGRGMQGGIIDSVVWDGANLDSNVVIRYGQWVREMIEKTHLVSLNADVQFRLTSDHAKSFWPYIDSQPNHSYVDEDMLANLAGRDLWSDDESSATRAQFRKDCRQAFDDMVRAGGLKNYTIEVTGTGRRKSRRYRYVHGLPRQMELEMQLESA